MSSRKSCLSHTFNRHAVLIVGIHIVNARIVAMNTATARIVAIGIVANTEGLGLATAGIETDRGFVQVDDHMRVLKKKGGETIPGLFCIGDANGNYRTLI